MQGSRARTIVLTLSLFSAVAPLSSHAEGLTPFEGTPLLTPLEIEDNGRQFVTVLDIGNGVGVFEGDILVPIASQISGRSTSVAARNFTPGVRGTLWPDGILPYTLDSGLTSSAASRILVAIDHWNANTPVQVVPRTDETDYVNFVGTNGCAAWMGRIGGEQEIYSSANCSVGNMIHEIGHALGLYHEHMRPDRDNFVTINWENIREDRAYNYNIATQNVQVNSPYDYSSIMHYGSGGFSTNGQPTITPLQTGVTIGQRVGLSDDDITGINALYSSNFIIDLALTPERPMSSSNINATLDLSNATDSSVELLRVSSILPNSVSFQSFSGTAWSCNTVGQALDCTGPSLQNADTTTLNMTMTAPNTVDELNFYFNVSGEVADGLDISLYSLANRTMTAVNDPPLIEVPEQSPVALVPLAEIDAAVARVEAEDLNGHLLQSFAVTSESHLGVLEIDPDTGDIFVKDVGAINALENETISLGVIVSDGFENATEATITIDVLKGPDLAPVTVLTGSGPSTTNSSTAAGLTNSVTSGSGGGVFMGFWLLLAFPLRRLCAVKLHAAF